jgi:hypothetical protein
LQQLRDRYTCKEGNAECCNWMLVDLLGSYRAHRLGRVRQAIRDFAQALFEFLDVRAKSRAGILHALSGHVSGVFDAMPDRRGDPAIGGSLVTD